MLTLIHSVSWTKSFLSYSDEIKINSPDEPGVAKIIAFTNWGILRGMESFSHLVTRKSGSSGHDVVRFSTFI